MSKEYLFLGIIVVLIILTGLFEFKKPQKEPGVTPRIEKEENSVTVAVEYFPQKSDNKSTNIEVALDTHSVDLSSFNFQKDVILETSGKTKTPQKVEEEEGATHHRKAELTFEKTIPPFNIIILNLENIPRRQFQFINLD